MLSAIKSFSMGRKAWLLLAISSFALEATALYFQHGMGLVPCVMCIYQRLALLAILAAGLIGCIAPRNFLVRWLALLLGFYGAVKGLLLAIKHVDYQLNPAPWNQCSFIPEFPQTMPLNKWFPALFEAGGSCNDIKWQFLGMSMPQWLIVVFAIYLIVIGIMILSQFKRTKRANRDLFR